ncbi:hypothetical protein VTN00DRAFT_9389 [Thermoascus crustaceus]|uniref:uncharacterized protein n=1 Tax=Thermoascus crustaceus TaxID=5088 RepID=UPI0037424BB3
MAASPLHDQTAPTDTRTLQMPPPPLHDPPDPPVTERLVRPEGAPLHRTLELQLEALHQPVDLEVDARVDNGVEVAAGMLQRQGIRVWEIRCNVEMQLRR